MKFRGKNNPKFHHETIFYRKLKNIHRLSFLDDLNSAPWSLLEVFQDVNDKLDIWDLIFNEVLDRHAPLIKKGVTSKQLPPWLNSNILNHMRLRDQFKARAKLNILANVIYKRLRNAVVEMIANAKSAYIKNEIESNLNNPKKLWKTLKRVAPKKSVPSMPSLIEVDGPQISDPLAMANRFNEYFVESQTSVVSNSHNEHAQHLTEQRLQIFVNDRIDKTTQCVIPEISRHQVEQDFMKIGSNKATGIDAVGILRL